jgi:hypothetical protein
VATAGGRVVVAGFAGGGESDFALARYDADGSLDAGFSGDGRQLTDFAGSNDRVLALARAAGDKIVAAGSAVTGSSPDFALARYDVGQAEAVLEPPVTPPPPPPPATPSPPVTPPPPAVPPPPPPAAAPDGDAPRATLSARARQHLRPTVAIGLTCHDEACHVSIAATVRIAGAAPRRLTTVTRRLAKGAKPRIELRLPRALQTSIRRALDRRRSVTVSIRATVADAAGNRRTLTLARPIRLTP